MSTCPNCGNQYTCSCQKKIATDGKEVCAKCVARYNATLNVIATRKLAAQSK